MMIEDHLSAALSPDGLAIAKERLMLEACEIIQSFSAQDLQARWQKGAREHGVMTDDRAMAFPARENLIEELQDAFWYSVLLNAQRSE